MNKSTLLTLYKRPETVFTLQEISLLFPRIPYANLKKRMSYLARTGAMQKLTKGVYAKDQYDVRELSNKLYTPSYISLETVLQKAGVTFQYYECIFAVSYITRTINIDDHTIEYRRFPKDLLINPRGITQEGNIATASPERAFLDAVFLYKNYHFDNLSTLDWDKIMELKHIYPSRVFIKRVEDYYQIFKEDYA
ncbi:hypothetical protein HY947_02265 [Candidatus Gottesmanbacteria bacterium]|nr:hypothetical protein [Candidatus Gottesmanbacteria bacterium]